MSEQEACNAAFRTWADSIDREDSEGDPREIISGSARAMWVAGRDWRALQAADTERRLVEALEHMQADLVNCQRHRPLDFHIQDALKIANDALVSRAGLAEPLGAGEDGR